jgi:hypothetical protein
LPGGNGLDVEHIAPLAAGVQEPGAEFDRFIGALK